MNVVVTNRIGWGDRACSLCGHCEEDVIHLFKECHVSRALAFASKWNLHTSSLTGGSSLEMVRNLLSKNNSHLEVLIKACFLGLVWTLRNGVVYGDQWNFETVLLK